ncbi:beta-N-acetylhexosaminidase [Chitinibacteraceae bacterium HSL-7]
MTTLRQRVGQCVLAGFDGFMPNEHITRLIRDDHIGGVILFRRNVESAEQVRALCIALQSIRAEVSDTPLLIGVDQEGGMVSRIEAGLTQLPSAMCYATHGSVDDCREMHRIGAEELRALGVNFNFAPVLDINNNRANPVIGVRAFGEDVATTCRYGLAAIEGMAAGGVLASAKHFPGHGDTAVDSHYGVPVVPHGRARLDEVELAPFRAAIAAGVPAIMSAHVVFEAIDASQPSTLSHAVLTGLLRDEMGFDGVVVTDCLEMAAVADGVGSVQGGVQAFNAGADLVLMSHTPERQRALVDALTQAVTEGVITEERLAESEIRLSTLRGRLGSPRPTEALRSPHALSLSKAIHVSALRWHGPDRQLNAAEPILLITVEVQQRTEIDEVALGKTPLERDSLLPYLNQRGCHVTEYVTGLTPDAAEVSAICTMARAIPQVVINSYNAALLPQQAELLRQLSVVAAGRLWLVAGRLPYDVELLADEPGLALCSNRPIALEVLAERLLG